MKLTTQDIIWNRAAMEDGGESPRAGDRALADLLYVHGMVMNGGVDHALGVVTAEEYTAAQVGFRYFGFDGVADLLEQARSVEVSEIEPFNAGYSEQIPSDDTLTQAFATKYAKSPEAFSPTEGGNA